jgi:hypothetical protein
MRGVEFPESRDVDVGCMSSDERKEVVGRSSRVLVMVRKLSSRVLSSAFETPLRSRIFWKLVKEASPTCKV